LGIGIGIPKIENISLAFVPDILTTDTPAFPGADDKAYIVLVLLLYIKNYLTFKNFKNIITIKTKYILIYSI
jgi:hypothetical protein